MSGTNRNGKEGCAKPLRSILRGWLGGYGSDCYPGLVAGRTCAIGGRFSLRTIGKPFLCTAFGLLALLFESLHFFLTLLVGSGHQVSFESEYAPVTTQALRLSLPARLTRLARGFAVIVFRESIWSSPSTAAGAGTGALRPGARFVHVNPNQKIEGHCSVLIR